MGIHKDIGEKIKSGEYFEDALDWYFIKYTAPLGQRSYFIIITAMAMLLAVLAIYILTMFLPLKQTLAYVVPISNKVDQYAELKYLGKPTEDPNQSVVKYLAGRYVTAYESYQFAGLTNTQYAELTADTGIRSNADLSGEGVLQLMQYVPYGRIRMIYNLSTLETFRQFVQHVSLNNPQSPILRYRRDITRSINILNVDILDKIPLDILESGQHKLVVRFRSTEVGASGVLQENWLAKIVLEYDRVVYSREEGRFSPLYFKVRSYEVEKLPS